jgi:hypothetical protein
MPDSIFATRHSMSGFRMVRPPGYKTLSDSEILVLVFGGRLATCGSRLRYRLTQ